MIHQKLKEFRKQKGLTQEQMADALHKSQNAYSLIELGKTKLDAELIPSICNVLNISPEELFESSVNFNFNDKVENGYATYIEILNTNNLEAITILKAELEEKNKTIQQLLSLLKKGED